MVPSTTTSRELHEGIADGESFNDPAMLFGGSAVTAANFWSGSDGSYWDDKTFTSTARCCRPGTTSRSNSQSATGECLTWAYSLLAYKN